MVFKSMVGVAVAVVVVPVVFVILGAQRFNS